MSVDSVKGQSALGVKKLESLEKSLCLLLYTQHVGFFRCVVLKEPPVTSGHYLLGY